MNITVASFYLFPFTQLDGRLRLIVFFFFFFFLNVSSKRIQNLSSRKKIYLSIEMVDSGKEFLMLDNYNNLPWLIWIQMFVFVLLLLLLCVVGIFSLDIGDNSCSSSDSVPSTSGSSLSKRFLSGNPIPIRHHGLGFSINSSLIQSNQIGSSQSIKGEITPAVTRRVTRIEEAEGSLEKESSHNLRHPCNLFRLAGTAFLKCFGIDRSTEETEDSLRSESKKER